MIRKLKHKWLLLTVALAISAAIFGKRLVVEYCAWNLSRPSHRCSSLFWNSGDETRLLIRTGTPAVPAISRRIRSPKTPLKQKIHLAWILGKIGDHSWFGVFLEGLDSPKQAVYFIAAVRMRDFPKQCEQHLDEILAAKSFTAPSGCRDGLFFMIEKKAVSRGARDRLYEIIYLRNPPGAPLSEAEIVEIKNLMGQKP